MIGDRKAPGWVADFDSATAMVRALTRFLRGKDFPALAVAPELPPLARLVNALPEPLLAQLYIWSGFLEAVPARRLAGVEAGAFARWATASYPERRYPAAAIGSSNGAAVHLLAALGAPWLPQSFLIPVRRTGIHPDEPREELAFGERTAPPLLAANEDLQLHHMHDPVQDRLMIRRMTYFRLKWLRLPEAYRRFLEERLEPGATIFVVDCALRWPTTRVADRHLFQFGALGGASVEDLFDGSERVRDFLAAERSHRRSWDPPAPDGERPEAEWGLEPSLLADLETLARKRGYRLVRLSFGVPDDLSPLVADLHRWWYARRGVDARRLLVESFIDLEPFWALRAAAVPFWITFPIERSAEAAERYLDTTEPYDDVRVLLFSHGARSIGLAPPERWKALAARGRQGGGLVAVDERRFPRDFGVYLRYRHEVRRLAVTDAAPAPLTLDELWAFLRERGDSYDVTVSG